MKHTIIFLALTLSALSYSQKTVDVIADFGRQKIHNPQFYCTIDGRVLLVFKDKKVIYDANGNKIDEINSVNDFKNPDYQSDENYFGYNSLNDFYYVDYKNQLSIVTDFSKKFSKNFIFKLPNLEGLIGSVRDSKDKSIYQGSGIYTGLKESQYIGQVNDEIVYATSYISRSNNSHGEIKPIADKYNSFVRVLFCNLKTNTVREEIILKDVFNINRAKGNLVMLKIISSKQGSLKIAAVSGSLNSGLYSGEMDVYNYDLTTKQLNKINSSIFELPKGITEIRADLNQIGLSLLYDNSKNENNAMLLKFKPDYSTDLIQFQIPPGKHLPGINSNNLVFPYISLKKETYLFSYCLFETGGPYEMSSISENGLFETKKVGQKYPMRYFNPETEEELFLEIEITDPKQLKELTEMVPSKVKLTSLIETNNWVIKNDSDEYFLVKLLRYDVAPQEIKLKFIPIGKL